MLTRERNLVIVGAGGLGREVRAAVEAPTWRRGEPRWVVQGFLDDDPALARTAIDGLPVLGDLLTPAPRGTSSVVAIASPSEPGRRRDVVERFGGRRAFATVAHPTAELGRGCTIDEGSILLAGVVATAGVRIGAHVVAMPNVTFTHDDVVGDFATLGAGVTVAGGVTIGEAAYIGSGASIREHVTIGDGAVIGMGSVVLRDVPPHEVWVGSPARHLDVTSDVPELRSLPQRRGRVGRP